MEQRNIEPLYQAFGRLVRLHRDRSGMTQEALGDEVGLSRTSITNIEKGRQHVPLHQVFCLAHALGVSVHALLPRASEAVISSWIESKLPAGTAKGIAAWATELIDEEENEENS